MGLEHQVGGVDEIEILRCARCGARMTVVAFITDRKALLASWSTWAFRAIFLRCVWPERLRSCLCLTDGTPPQRLTRHDEASPPPPLRCAGLRAWGHARQPKRVLWGF